MRYKIKQESETAKKLQELSRHEMIAKVLSDILTDITICKLEGGDWREYPIMIKNEIDRFLK